MINNNPFDWIVINLCLIHEYWIDKELPTKFLINY